MGINVKNAEVEAEIRLLAEELDVSLTEAILDAVRSRRERLAAERAAAHAAKVQYRMERIREMQDSIRHLIPPGTTSSCDEFYDEDGLPA